MRVLHVHSGNLYGGVERILETLVEWRGECPDMETTAALCFEGRLSEALTAAGAPVHRLGAVQASRPWQVARAQRALSETLSAHRPDVAVVHSDWGHALFGSTIRSAGVPLVRWMHAPEPGPAWQALLAERAAPGLVICNSQYTCRASAGRFAGAPRTICYAPVPPQVGSTDRSAARAAAGVSQSTLVILMAARIEPCKGHRSLLRALTMLPKDCDWQAWIAGGPQRSEEKRLLKALVAQAACVGLAARVRFLGERTDIQSLMCAADVYCQPNQTPESYGLSFIEAMGAGLPVLSTQIGALPEIVDSSCGVLVPTGRIEELARALERLIANPEWRQQLSRGARARASLLGNVSTRLALLAEAFQSVPSNGRAAVVPAR